MFSDRMGMWEASDRLTMDDGKEVSLRPSTLDNAWTKSHDSVQHIWASLRVHAPHDTEDGHEYEHEPSDSGDP